MKSNKSEKTIKEVFTENKKMFIISALISSTLFLILVLFFNYQDNLYEQCMEDQAKEICARHEKELAKFSSWHPSFECVSIESTNLFTINLYYTEDNLIYIFNESEIQKCWNYSRE